MYVFTFFFLIVVDFPFSYFTFVYRLKIEATLGQMFPSKNTDSVNIGLYIKLGDAPARIVCQPANWLTRNYL